MDSEIATEVPATIRSWKFRGWQAVRTSAVSNGLFGGFEGIQKPGGIGVSSPCHVSLSIEAVFQRDVTRFLASSYGTTVL